MISFFCVGIEDVYKRQGVVCAVMDARCNQVYNALFTVEQGVITRLTEDRALSIDQLEQDLLKIEKPIFFVGDGADLCYNKIKYVNLLIATVPEALRMQRASGCLLYTSRCV